MSYGSEERFKHVWGNAMRGAIFMFLNCGDYERAYQQCEKMK